MVTTASRLPSLLKRLNARKIDNLPGGAGIKVESKSILGGIGDLDVIGQDAKGYATGLNAHEIYAQLHPKEYAEFAKNYTLNQSGKIDLDLSDVALPIKSEDLYNEWKQSQTELKGLMDALGSSREKHVNRVIGLIQNPDKTELFREALRRKVMSSYGEDIQVSNLIPSFDYSNVEANRNFLKSLGLDEDLATNEDVMKNIVDYVYFSLGTSTRRVARRGMPNRGKSSQEVIDALQTNTSSTGSARGRAGNSTSGNGGAGSSYGPIIGGLLEDITHGNVPQNPE